MAVVAKLDGSKFSAIDVRAEEIRAFHAVAKRRSSDIVTVDPGVLIALLFHTGGEAEAQDGNQGEVKREFAHKDEMQEIIEIIKPAVESGYRDQVGSLTFPSPLMIVVGRPLTVSRRMRLDPLL